MIIGGAVGSEFAGAGDEIEVSSVCCTKGARLQGHPLVRK